MIYLVLERGAQDGCSSSSGCLVYLVSARPLLMFVFAIICIMSLDHHSVIGNSIPFNHLIKINRISIFVFRLFYLIIISDYFLPPGMRLDHNTTYIYKTYKRLLYNTILVYPFLETKLKKYLLGQTPR